PDRQTLHFAGRVISVTTDEVVLPNGHRAVLEVVHHPGGAAAAALDENGRVCLLRQYRYVAGGWLWELPAGKLEPSAPALLTAHDISWPARPPARCRGLRIRRRKFRDGPRGSTSAPTVTLHHGEISRLHPLAPVP